MKYCLPILIFVVVNLFSIANSQLSVYSPQALKEQFVNNKDYTIDYSIGNFGRNPYGRTLVGPVVVADPIDACQPLKAINPKEISDAPFIIAKRGNCTFVTKTTYAQLIGAKMMIMVDDRFETPNSVMMLDDGHAYQLNIPAILISKQNGEKILNYLQSDNESKQQVTLNIKFESKQQSHVEYVFWLKVNDRVSSKLVREFNPFHINFQQNVQFTPRYQVWECNQCRKQNFTQDEVPSNCLGGGRYCLQNPSFDQYATGRDMLYETLRQICIYNLYPEKWWKYVGLIDITCVTNLSGIELCSLQVMKQLQIDQIFVNQCVNSSFEANKMTGTVEPQRNANNLLEKEKEAYLQSGVHYWPSVSVDNVQFRGNMIAEDIFEDVCSAFENPPVVCEKVLDIKIESHENDQKINIEQLIFIILIFLVVFGLGMVFVYKRMVKNEMQRDMSSQVNTMVSQYIAFYETKEKNNQSKFEMSQQ